MACPATRVRDGHTLLSARCTHDAPLQGALRRRLGRPRSHVLVVSRSLKPYICIRPDGVRDPPKSLCDVVDIIVPHLVRHTQLGGKRLKHLVLEKHLKTDEEEDISMMHIDDVLAPLRGLVKGLVEYKVTQRATTW